MKTKHIIYVIASIAIIGLLAWPKIKNGKEKQVPGQTKKGGPVKVVTWEVHPQTTTRTIETTGNILAEEEVVLYPEAQGRIVHIAFSEGAEVKKGQLLIKINDADLQAQLKKAVISRKLREETEGRNKQLLEKGAVSQESYDLSLTDLNSIDADIDLLREQIRKTEIRAPFSGKIGLRNVSEGSYVSPSTRIAALQNLSRVKIEFSVPERYAAFIKTGNTISFSIEGNSKPVEAVVYAIEPKVDEVTRNVIMRAMCDNPSQKILPGGFAKVTVGLGNNTSSFLIPTQAVVPILKGQKVFVAQGDSAVERIVKTGIRSDDHIEIVSGLNEGDRVIVEGVMYLRQGARISATPQKQSPVKPAN